MRLTLRGAALVAALLTPLLAIAGHVTATFGAPFDPRLKGALTYTIRYGCSKSGQYERVPIVTQSPQTLIDDLPDVGRCYFSGTIENADASISETGREEAFDFATEEQVPPAPTAAPSVTWTRDVAPAGLSITGLTPSRYKLGTLAVGGLVYVDRDYKWTDVGTLGGSVTVMLANDDKLSSVAIGFTINRAATVYVGVDTRHPKPAWLSAWTAAGSLAMNESSGPRYNVYRRDFAAGAVSFTTSAFPSSSSNNYVVVVK